MRAGSRMRHATWPWTVTAWKSAVTGSKMKSCARLATGIATIEVVGLK